MPSTIPHSSASRTQTNGREPLHIRTHPAALQPSAYPRTSINTVSAPSTSAPSNTMPSHSSSSSSQSSTSTRPPVMRSASQIKRMQAASLHIPIPPTLVNSPHIHSPTSIFRRPYAGPKESPGAEEDFWLRDTIPQQSSRSNSVSSEGSSYLSYGVGQTQGHQHIPSLSATASAPGSHPSSGYSPHSVPAYSESRSRSMTIPSSASGHQVAMVSMSASKGQHERRR